MVQVNKGISRIEELEGKKGIMEYTYGFDTKRRLKGFIKIDKYFKGKETIVGVYDLRLIVKVIDIMKRITKKGKYDLKEIKVSQIRNNEGFSLLVFENNNKERGYIANINDWEAQ